LFGVLGVARVESQIFDRPKVKTGPKNLKGSRDECPPGCVDDFFSSLFFSFFLLSWILIVMGKQPLEHGILQPLRACELIIDNLLCHALRHQQLASLTGLSAWSGLSTQGSKTSFYPSNLPIKSTPGGFTWIIHMQWSASRQPVSTIYHLRWHQNFA
jgi:hypothetical protein